jgi:hypothetical protein
MKISVAVQVSPDEDPIDDMVIQNLKDVGFVEQAGTDGNMTLIFDGDISNNDLAYGASMCRSMQKR